MKNSINKPLIIIIALLISGLFNFIFTDSVDAATGPVTVSLTANQTNINKGDRITLSWNSTNTDFCSAHSDIQSPWYGIRAISGNETITPTETAVYFITCSNISGFSGRAQATVNVGATSASPVSVNITANPESIFRGESTTLIWSSTNAVSCEASGYWSGMKPTFGSERVSPSSTVYYTLRCSGSVGQSASDTQSIFVNPATALPTATPIPAPVSIPIISRPTIKPAAPVVRIVKLPIPADLKPSGKELAGDIKEVTLSWNAVKGAKFYAVRVDFPNSTLRDARNNCPGNPHYVCINGLTENKLSIDVEPGQKYSWWVHAVDSWGNLSEPASARFSVKDDQAGARSSFLANIFSGVKGGAFSLGLIILAFILGYTFGKRKNKFQTPPLKI